MNCSLCENVFKTPNELFDHITNIHELKRYDVYRCAINSCGQVFQNFNTYKNHVVRTKLHSEDWGIDTVKPLKENHEQNSQEDVELLKLLKEWKLEELFQSFKKNGVNVAVLKVIKIRHLERLLEEFKLGTAILFEHHLEKWRKSIGAPLLGMATESALFRHSSASPSNLSAFPSLSRSLQTSQQTQPTSSPYPHI